MEKKKKVKFLNIKCEKPTHYINRDWIVAKLGEMEVMRGNYVRKEEIDQLIKEIERE